MAFTPEIGATFADTWYRVAPSRPRLSPHANIIHQRYGPMDSYIVEDPAGGRFYRLSESAYHFAALLDGERSVDDAWNTCLAQLGDDAPTQRECLELLGQLQLFGLLLGQLPLAADMVAERRTMVRKQRLKQYTGNWLFFTIPLINPEPALERTKHLFAPLFTVWGLLIWMALLGSALFMVLSNPDRLGSSLNTVLEPSNLIWLTLSFLVIRAVHEAGHAIACKAMGARCTEIGVMLIAYVLPLPYCDATASWRLPETWKRVLVALAGMIFELVLAAFAVFVWATAESGLPRTLAFNLMIISGVSTIVFNLNPLLRYDGYYILSDLLGSPNLAQRAREIWIYMTERFGFGQKHAKPPVLRDNAEAWTLGVYHFLSVPYRLIVLASILTVVATQYLTLGVLLAAFFAVVWLAWPLTKGLWYLLTSPKLIGRRFRAIGVSAAVLVPVAVVLGIIPVPAAGYAEGVVEPRTHAMARAGEAGFLDEVAVSVGDRVEAGQVIATLSNPVLETEYRKASASLSFAQAELDEALTDSPSAIAVAEGRVRAAEARLAQTARSIEKLVIRASVDGVVMGPENSPLGLDTLTGLYLNRGDAIAEIIDTDTLVIRALLPDDQRAYVSANPITDDEGRPRASVRVRGTAGTNREGIVIRQAPVGTRELSNPVLGSLAGGAAAVDPQNPDLALLPHFVVDVQTADTERMVPGQRARVRFPVAPEPLVTQWSRRLQRFIQGAIRS